MIKIPSVNYEIQVDRILLEQDVGSGEINQIELHRMHLEHIASKFGMPSLSNTAESILKKLQLVTRRLIDISANEYYRTEIVERCGSGADFYRAGWLMRLS